MNNKAIISEILARYGANLPHALLLYGFPGIGKSTLVSQLAERLLCDTPKPDAACGQCHSCNMLRAGTHPDLFTVGLISDGDKVAKEIKVDQIRDICARLQHTRQHSAYKIAIIDPAERMNRNAANSLLKTLEEPTDNTLLILVASQPALLPATIASRCQKVQIPKSDISAIQEYCHKQYPELDANSLIAAADGSPKKIDIIAAEGLLNTRSELFKTFVSIARERKDPVSIAALWTKTPIDWLFVWLISWLEDLIRLQYTTGSIVNQDFASDLQSVASKLDVLKLFEFYDHTKTHAHWARGNANIQLLLEKLLFDWFETSDFNTALGAS